VERPGRGKVRVYSRLFLARLETVRPDYQYVTKDFLHAVGAPNQWVASNHAATSAD
jgi:hypothetical protein